MVKRLADAAFTSRLSGLFNKAAFDLLANEHDRGVGDRLAVAFMDLTGFKSINEKYGHDAGDAAIKRAGSLLQGVAMDVTGHAYHISGDEFLLVMRPDIVDRFRERTKMALNEFTVEFEKISFVVRANVGVALPRSEASVLDELRAKAESACRLAKAQGSNEAVIWSDGQDGEDELIDKRWRCVGCNATVSMLLPKKSRRDGLYCCINCGQRFPD